MVVKKGLGKGLSALIPEGSVFTGGRTIVNIGIEKVVPNPNQTRTTFDEAALKELAESIKTSGVVQPILVRMRKGSYELVAGERRLRAAKIAGLANVPAIIKDFNDEESAELALIENIQREDLNPMDEAEAYGKLASQFNLSQVQISEKVGKNRSTVANMMRLLDLPLEVQKSLKKGDLSTGHARALLSVEDKEKLLSLFKDIIKNKMSVRDVEFIIYGVTKKASPKKTAHRKSRVAEDLKEWVEKLTTHLATKVHMRGDANRGKIEIEYFSQEDLERVLDIILASPSEIIDHYPPAPQVQKEQANELKDLMEVNDIGKQIN